MANVLLMTPLSELYAGIKNYGMPALGPHRIASFLRSSGHNVVVYDSNIHPPETLLSIYAHHFDIIGISVLNDTLKLSLERFLELREYYPDALLVAGGAEATLNYQDIFENTTVDVVILGEGEYPMLDLCQKKPMGDIKGIIHRNYNREINGDLLWDYYKDLDFGKMGYREYWKQNKAIGDNQNGNYVRLVSSSHCLRNCGFCSLSSLRNAACGHVVKPAWLTGEQIDVLLARIKKQLPETDVVYFVEDSILPVRNRIDDFCAALQKQKHHLKYMVQTETDKVSEEEIRKLAEAGVFHISFGVENCSPSVRKLINKPQDSEHIEDIIGWCNKYNIRCYYLIILFIPGTTIEDLVINYKTLSSWLDKEVVISVEPFMMPYRGAPIFYKNYKMDYHFYRLPNRKTLKHPYIIYPDDEKVRCIMERFKERRPAYIDLMNKEDRHGHQSKDYTGRVHVRLLGDLLKEGGYL